MGKKKYFGSDNIISIYKLMEICGLSCPCRGNIAISHKIALRKLNLRHEEHPDKVTVPKLVPFSAITDEAVMTGRIILVKDDCKNICGYLRPSEFFHREAVSKIFDDLFHDDEYYEEKEEELDEFGLPKEEKVEFIRPGERKYILRHRREGRIKFPKIDKLTSKDREKIRKRLIEEEMAKEENTGLKPGEIKYIKRKSLRKRDNND